MANRFVVALRILLALTVMVVALAVPTDAAAHGGPDLGALFGDNAHGHDETAGRGTRVDVRRNGADADAAQAEPAGNDHCGCPDCSDLTCATDDDPNGTACSNCPSCDNHVGPSSHPHALPPHWFVLVDVPPTNPLAFAARMLGGDDEPGAPFVPPRS